MSGVDEEDREKLNIEIIILILNLGYHIIIK